MDNCSETGTTTMNHCFKLCHLLLATALFAGCATQDADRPQIVEADDDAFAVPAGLEPQVEFWRKVYSHWGQNQAVLHDDRHLRLVYAELTLPGPLSDHYTAEQRDYVHQQKAWLQARLAELERRVGTGEPLDPGLQRLAGLITDTAGRGAIFGAADRLRSQRGLRERFKRGLEISGRYDAAFRQVFHKAGLPGDLAYLPHVESSFQAQARSSAGAAGMWQFTRGAARTFMNNHPALDERLDPLASARGAARYLGTAYRELGSWPLALTSYNHGINGMRRARDRYGDDFARIVRDYDHPAFGFASRNFYAEFLAASRIAHDPQRYFPEGIRYQQPLNRDNVVLAEHQYAWQLARRFGVDKSTLVALNPAWTGPAARDEISLPAGVSVWLPAGTLARNRQLNEPVIGLADEALPPTN